MNNLKYLLLKTTDISYAWSLSAALWKITSPNPTENDTLYYSEPIFNGTHWALPLGPESHRIHPETNYQPLCDLIQVPEEEKDGLRDGLLALRGTNVRVEDLIPPSWSEAIMTEEQAEQLGYFNEEEE